MAMTDEKRKRILMAAYDLAKAGKLKTPALREAMRLPRWVQVPRSYAREPERVEPRPGEPEFAGVYSPPPAYLDPPTSV